MVAFDQRIEAAWPDVAVPGWMVVQLECGHLTHQPKDFTNKTAHCGVCALNHASHQRELAAFEKRQATPETKKP